MSIFAALDHILDQAPAGESGTCFCRPGLCHDTPMNTHSPFESWAAEQMPDSEFRASAKEMEPGYQLARLHLLHGLTQQQLAEMVGPKQPSVARLESGTVEPRISFLRKVAAALDSRVEIRIVPIPKSDD